MSTTDTIRQIVSKTGRKYGIKSAYLFGSYAKNTATEDSDIDILIDRGNVKSYDDYYHLHEELRSKLGKEVDLLATDGVRPKFSTLSKTTGFSSMEPKRELLNILKHNYYTFQDLSNLAK